MKDGVGNQSWEKRDTMPLWLGFQNIFDISILQVGAYVSSCLTHYNMLNCAKFQTHYLVCWSLIIHQVTSIFQNVFHQSFKTFIFRAGIMYSSSSTSSQPEDQLKSNMFSLSGVEFFGAVGRSINLGGQTALALRLLLALFSSKISSDVDRPFGDEFRAARMVSEEIGAQIVLGDRPIEITLERAWNSLKGAEKLSLVGSVLRGITSSSEISKDNVKELGTDDDSPYKLYEKLSSAYPSLVRPLILERDTYLSWSLKRSKAVNNSKRVVGVMGKGHLNGVIYALISDLGDLRFRDLAGKKSGTANVPNAWISKVVKDLVRDTVIGIVLWALYEQLKSGFSE
ncbi:uncharacterized protein [Spinacia oleracea]|uniref:Uncharacterized protein isoform X2 n=1 Tax=Spinacia oleracea TaxID=3562 RepID=A0ABM3RF95_SPIOL|nr:uncharacterized protein LOC110782462 isoform X2 [Spinacia oleracea]